MRKCVGCGYCCMKAPCIMGVTKYKLTPGDRCPALCFVDGKYRCKDYDFKKWESVFGIGCTSSLNTWRRDVKER